MLFQTHMLLFLLWSAEGDILKTCYLFAVIMAVKLKKRQKAP